MKAGGTVSYQTFDKLWLRDCPDVIMMKPKEDVCGECSNLQSIIVRAKTEEARQTSVDALRTHMEHANKARDHYRDVIQKAKDAIKLAAEHNNPVPNFEHYTFDFAQQATIPHHAREVGALYFKVPHRIQLFGIASEATPSQHNYMFGEHHAIGIDGSKSHGPNSVLFMLHFHLEQYSLAKTICLHADNCYGQNKNKTVIAYPAWRVIVGLIEEIELSFMRVGHTRCLLDGGFGLLKQRYRKSDIELYSSLQTLPTSQLPSTKRCCSLGNGESGTPSWRNPWLCLWKMLPSFRNFVSQPLNLEKCGCLTQPLWMIGQLLSSRPLLTLLLWTLPHFLQSSNLLECLVLVPTTCVSKFAPTAMRKIATLRAQIQVKPWRSDVRVFSVLCSQHTIHCTCIFYNNTNLSFTFLICFWCNYGFLLWLHNLCTFCKFCTFDLPVWNELFVWKYWLWGSQILYFEHWHICGQNYEKTKLPKSPLRLIFFQKTGQITIIITLVMKQY